MVVYVVASTIGGTYMIATIGYLMRVCGLWSMHEQATSH
jgi:hypothetical protein